MKCSIVIRSYNEASHIGRLIDGIHKQHLPDGYSTEIILVDSGSTDSTVAIAESMGAKIVSIDKNEFSFGRALNRGCEHANGDILIFASAHVYPIYEDWIAEIIKEFKNEEIAIVYGKQTGNEITAFSEQQIFNRWFPSQSNLDQNHPFCNNANCAIRKSLWAEQKYDENLTGLEDLDWAQRIISLGYKIVYKAEAVIVHVHNETPLSIRNRYRREAIAIKQIVPKINFSFFKFIKLFIINSFSDFLEAIRVGKFFSLFRSIVIFRYNQFYGTYLGHAQKGTVSKDLTNIFYYPSGFQKKQQNSNEELEQKRIKYH
jgi:rhamnosyltransferase